MEVPLEVTSGATRVRNTGEHVPEVTLRVAEKEGTVPHLARMAVMEMVAEALGITQEGPRNVSLTISGEASSARTNLVEGAASDMRFNTIEKLEKSSLSVVFEDQGISR